MTTTQEKSAARTTAEGWLDAFGEALAARDVDRAVSLFAEQSYWRDLVSFTWNLKTVEHHAGVRDLLENTLEGTDPSRWELSAEPAEADGVTEAWFTFATAVGRGSGHVRIVDGKAWTLLTTLDELTGHEEPMRENRPFGTEHGANPDRVTWKERREEELSELGRTRDPEVVIIGGGQGGIALGARLRQLGVPTIIVERNERPGDSWRRRYKSLALHDPVWYDHLPYLKFPDNWPVFAPKDKIGDWLEFYTRIMELNYWGSTTARSAEFDEATGRWTVVVDRAGEEVTLRPRQVVVALGVSGKPNVPDFPGREQFRGEVQHSSQHPGPDAYQGKKVVVIGSNNSAFDICGALWEVGADVTMVQRSSTHIIKSDTLMEYGLGDLYSERAVKAGVDTYTADMIFASLPYRIMAQFQKPAYDKAREVDADFYQRLTDAGFELDFGDDDSGLFMKYLRRGSGYYIDVGAAELVADGKVKLVRGQMQEFTEKGVRLTGSDGATVELDADLVVFATGYRSMNGLAADIVGQDVADKVGKVWGLGSDTTKDPGPWEGEQRNMWKPTQQQNLWFHGGNLHQSRFYSLYLALQLKARQEGISTPVYALQERHHLS
ncbi:FAD-dependent oxidoreductase [Pseudonocardia sp. EC080610-09]|uniref:NAD(P)/FAD-dependent oxidoreductase n=1 Tax=unclassified Pseudonocardia TaxID=2619320 RepID=UPI0001FFECCC|nr:FAD-dependent oxidoreductase [Pseudonocardia sp. EC080625-04]ALL77587.1 FAD-dependent oxidoreductase [Pseudonocardia sp. EC080610-09]ALL80503.1 FAD-dependent oxidoreductase [Pseudonocardia sp. EC080619-01]OLM17672.1 Flavin-containing monooxygenase [Pseudonocardia sp. Ae707_Ps1]